jgi:hypothetical protein
MTELEKLVDTWEKHKPTGTPHEHICNGFIDDAKAAIEREKQASSIAIVVEQREQFKCGVQSSKSEKRCEKQCKACELKMWYAIK